MENRVRHIIKRDGKKVDFNAYKIREAIRQAFLSQGLSLEDTFDTLTDDTIKVIELTYSNEHLPTVEDIQDVVEKVIIKHNHADIAKAFIIYRERHKFKREQAVLQKIKEHNLIIKTRNNEEVPFEEEVIRKHLRNLCFGLSNVRIDNLTADVCKSVYQNISTSEIEALLLGATKTRIEQHYDYSLLSARLLLDRLYKDILQVSLDSGDLKARYQQQFKHYIKEGVHNELLDSRLESEFDLETLSRALDPASDLKFYYLGVQTVLDRYLLRRRLDQRVFELPSWMWMRVAMGLALNEDKKEKRAIQFYQVLSNFYLVSSTPTLFNSGTRHSQMSSCYLNTVDDSLEGIFKNFSDNAQLSKWAGGIGTDWTAVRGTGAYIKGTNGKSSGVIPFIKIFNDVAIAVNQGGKRKGAMAAYLENWHIDVEEFIELKKNTGDERRRAHDIHPALFISDLFMKRVKADGDWTLFSPHQVPGLHQAHGKEFEDKYIEFERKNLPGSKTLKAKDLWKRMLTMLYETGHPWITFKCACNVRSPQDHVGTVHSSNLCTEITLNTAEDETAVCNLASLNLGSMIKAGTLNEGLIKSTVGTGMRMLDNVVDLNYYPTVESENSNRRHRPVGLGLMGYQDALYQLGIPFDSDDNIAFADRSMEMVSYYAILSSSKLAQERGTYSTYAGSKWDRGLLPLDTLDLLAKERGEPLKIDRTSTMDWGPVRESIKKHGMRNSNTMAIAPTATIANIAGVVPCVEPIFKNIYMKENLSGNFCVVNRYLIDHLQQLGLWTPDILAKIKLNNGSVANVSDIPADLRRKFKEVFEIEARWVIGAAAKRSKWIDQSASTNLFLNTKSGKEISDIYTAVWEMGMKTTYYLRTLAASQIDKTTTLESDVVEGIPKASEEEVGIREDIKVGINGRDAMKAVAVTVGSLHAEANTVDRLHAEAKACLVEDPDCEACQ